VYNAAEATLAARSYKGLKLPEVIFRIELH
jgi:hypothetical protein